MNPRLVALAGPFKGSVFPLEDETTLGRDPANSLSAADGALSRRHCVFRRRADAVTVEDLESRNGTFVNGVPVKKRALEHGDQVEAGSSCLILVCDDASPEPSGSVPSARDDDLRFLSTVIKAPAGGEESDGAIVGESSAIRELLARISKIAESDATVLLLGESGTGKEQAARALHAGSPRAERPFVAVNCAALSESLLESELFGHERGAFTGAVATRKGKLELADGGTFFLDEVGDLSPRHQAKLLRVIQERQFERVGGTRPISVDIRLVAATNRNLRQAVDRGEFRDDLFYRLDVVSLTLPPLRERGEDLSLLASYFAARHGRRLRRRVCRVSPEARQCLSAYSWPGNVRELSNAIERAIVLGEGDLIRPEDLPESVLESVRDGARPLSNYHEAILRAKRDLIESALKTSAGAVTEAARCLGVHPNYLHRLIRNLGIRNPAEP